MSKKTLTLRLLEEDSLLLEELKRATGETASTKALIVAAHDYFNQLDEIKKLKKDLAFYKCKYLEANVMVSNFNNCMDEFSKWGKK